MHRQAMFGRQQRPQQLYSGNSRIDLDGTGLSDEDSFEGKNSVVNNVCGFRLRSLDVSSPCPPERRTYRTGVPHGYAQDLVDDIDEYPEYGDQANVNVEGDPSHWGPEARAFRYRENGLSLSSQKCSRC